MADIFNLENMNDDEVKDLVLQELGEYPEIDVDLIEVNVRNGAVTLAGRVGTEQELQQIEQVLTDVVGITNVTNDLVIDELTRGERSTAADDAYAEEGETTMQVARDRNNTSDEAAHLMDDVETDQFGTTDPQEAVERGTSYEPPDSPVQQGSSREDH